MHPGMIMYPRLVTIIEVHARRAGSCADELCITGREYLYKHTLLVLLQTNLGTLVAYILSFFCRIGGS
jgi:hypothetical protein